MTSPTGWWVIYRLNESERATRQPNVADPVIRYDLAGFRFEKQNKFFFFNAFGPPTLAAGFRCLRIPNGVHRKRGQSSVRKRLDEKNRTFEHTHVKNMIFYVLYSI